MAPGDVSIEPLDEHNYSVWHTRVKFLLVSKGLWTSLAPGAQGAAPAPAADATTTMLAAAAAAAADYNDKDLRALALIILHVKDHHLAALEHCSTAKEAWDLLEKTYKSKLHARRLQLRKDMNNLCKEPSEPLTKYLDRARTLWSELQAAGHDIKSTDVVLHVLNGLPKEYETIVTYLESQETELELDQLLPRLLVVEQRLLRQEESDNKAFFTNTRSRRTGNQGSTPAGSSGYHSGNKAGYHGSAFSHYGSGGSTNSTLSNSNNTGYDAEGNKLCFYCNKAGHLIRDCRKKKADEEKASKQPSVALMATTSPTDLAANLDHWTVDSGATKHVSPYLQLFSNYQALDTGINVTFGNGTSAPALGTGQVRLTTIVEGMVSDFKLVDVLYVPGCTAGNLFSVKHATGNGAHIFFNGNKCDISVGGILVAQASSHSGLYSIKAVHQEEAATVAKIKETPELWHRRFGHLGFGNLAKLVSNNMVSGIGLAASDFTDKAKSPVPCEPCVLGKQSRLPFPTSTTVTTKPLELLHMDVCGPMQVKSLGGSRYLATFLDEHTGLSVASPLPLKSDVPSEVQLVFNMLEAQSGHKVLTVRTDNGGEYLNRTLEQFFTGKGIIHQTTVPYTPEQNGAAERLNRTFMERVRALLLDSGLPKSLWAEAAVTVNYLRNRSPSLDRTKTPLELFFNIKPDVSDLRVFGSTVYAHIPKALRRKLDPVSQKGKMVGYDSHSKAYRVLLDSNNTVTVCRDITFDESVPGPDVSLATPTSLHEFLESAEEEELVHGGEILGNMAPAPTAVLPVAAPAPGNVVPAPAAEPPVAAPGPGNVAPAPAAVLPVAAPAPELRRGDRARRAPGEWYKVNVALTTYSEPLTYEEAMAAPDCEQWKQAMDEEMASLLSNDTWTLEKLPRGVKPLSAKWVFKVKLDSNGNIERYKARLVVKGFMQREGVDFNDTYAPVSKHTSLRTLLSLVASEDLELRQLDVKTAFLNGELEEDIYMKQPPGYESGGHDMVCHLQRALYGLRQAPRAWYSKLKEVLEGMGFQASETDPGLFILHTQSVYTYMLVYVDDLLVAAKTSAAVECVVSTIMSAFDIRDLGAPSTFIGIEIIRDRASRTLKIYQKKMASELVSKYGLLDGKTKSTPLSTSIKLCNDPDDLLDTTKYGYSELIGSLLYLAVCSRPDIAQAVGALARYMAKPTTAHWQAGLGVLRYIAGTTGYGILFTGNFTDTSPTLHLLGYCDADYAGDMDTRRSTTGYVYILNGGAVSWSSKLQPTVAASTTEAEYMAAAHAAKEALWLRKLFNDFNYNIGTLEIFCDNQTAIRLIKDPIASLRSKHIAVHHHFVRERVARKELIFTYISTDKMVADSLTKALSEQRFSACRIGMGVS